MIFRALTPSEVESFINRHFFVNWFIPQQGKSVYDEVLLGFVLLFKKQDGTIIYTLTEKDYAADDPSSVNYIVGETIKAIGENSQRVFSGIGTGLKMTTPILILVIIIIFRNEIKIGIKELPKTISNFTDSFNK